MNRRTWSGMYREADAKIHAGDGLSIFVMQRIEDRVVNLLLLGPQSFFDGRFTQTRCCANQLPNARLRKFTTACWTMLAYKGVKTNSES